MRSPDYSRLAYIDSLRFVAASLVLIQHLFETRSNTILMPFLRLGPGVAGVALFFFISGFVIPFSARQPFDWRAFMMRRLFRIYPLFLAAIALVFLLGITGILPRWADMQHASASRWIANLALVQELVGKQPFLGVSWTLAIELIWYSLFAASLTLLRESAAKWLDVVITIVLLGLALVSLAHGARIPLGRPIMIYAAIIGFQCWRSLSGQLSPVELAGSVARFVAVAGFASYVAFGHFHHPTITFTQDIGPWTLALAIFLAVVLVRPLRESRWLNHGPLPILGGASYSIYLLHPVVINAADLYLRPAWQVPAVVVGTIGLALASYRFIERPGINLGRRVVKSLLPATGHAVSTKPISLSTVTE